MREVHWQACEQKGELRAIIDKKRVSFRISFYPDFNISNKKLKRAKKWTSQNLT